MHGSTAFSRYAFALQDEPKRAIVVFTEHCGHRVLPKDEASIRMEPFVGRGGDGGDGDR